MKHNYISTASLYDSGEHLTHARTYSHKYIKREPDGHGGYRYYYKTDLALGNRQNNIFSRESKQNSNAYLYDGQPMNFGTTTPKIAREAYKASQIYREGRHQNEIDYQSRINQAYKETKPKVSKEYQEESEADTKKPQDFYVSLDPKTGQPIVLDYNEDVVTIDPKTRKPIVITRREYNELVASTKKKSISDYAKQAIDAISTAAGSLYDKGKNFLKNLFN